MKELTIKEIQNIANDILKYIKTVCDDNGIKFYLAYGTALGAIRHKGFIPWDDDVDIFMERDEFDKFYSFMEKDQSKYKLLYVNADKNYTLPLPKVIDTTTEWTQTNVREFMPLGVYVDIFILDNIPDDKDVREKHFNILDKKHKLWHFFQYKRNYTAKDPITLLKRLIYKIVNPKIFAKQLDRIASKYNNDNTSYIGQMTFVTDPRNMQMFPREWFGDGVVVTFCDTEYLVPKEYDKFLTQCFGDYMTPPPVSERVSHHTYIAYKKGNSQIK